MLHEWKLVLITKTLKLKHAFGSACMKIGQVATNKMICTRKKVSGCRLLCYKHQQSSEKDSIISKEWRRVLSIIPPPETENRVRSMILLPWSRTFEINGAKLATMHTSAAKVRSAVSDLLLYSSPKIIVIDSRNFPPTQRYKNKHQQKF